MDIEKPEELLNAEDILGTDDVEYVTVKAWSNRPIRLQSLNAGDLIDFIQTNDGPAKHTAGLRLIIKSAVDKNNNLLFTDKNLEALKKKNSKITNVIIDAILKLNGLDPKSKDAAKNASGETVPDASPTVSR